MHNINVSLSDIQNTHHKQMTATYADSPNIEKTENKPTEKVNAIHKTEHKTEQKITSDNNNRDKKNIDKQLTENIIKEKLLDSAVKVQAKVDNASLEAEVTDKAPSDGLITQTALEVAVKQKDILESVKSVKPDGTETYYFPVPVEVLTQLPPPGNLGLSAKMLDDILKQSEQDKVTDNQEIKIQAKQENAEKINLEKTAQNKEAEDIALKYQVAKAEKDLNDTGSLKTLFSD